MVAEKQPLRLDNNQSASFVFGVQMLSTSASESRLPQ
jgi:hypothetical protein